MFQPRVQTTSERSDDIPLIIYGLQELNVAEIMDAALPPSHGNRQGLSYGQLSVVLLCYILSQSDHRLCAVEEWAQQNRSTLALSTGWAIGAKDCSDDRLAALVELIGKQQLAREEIEVNLGQRMIHAYELPTEVARCDTTSFSVYHQIDEQQSESLLRFGYSKDNRPDLRQYRQLLGTLDPAGIPLVSETLAGNGADDPVYLPTWEKLVQVIGHKEFLYIADAKAAAYHTRSQLAQRGGAYCFPLPNTGQTPALLRQWVLNPPTEVQPIHLSHAPEEAAAIGVGFEMELGKFQYETETEPAFHWMERYFVVRSDALAQRQQKSLQQRLDKAEQELSKLAAKSAKNPCVLKTKVEAVLTRHRVRDCFQLDYPQTPDSLTTSSNLGGRPRQARFQLEFAREPAAIWVAEQLAGWRLYVSNVASKDFCLPQAVAYYRDQYQLEHGFHRFKRGHLPALPIYFTNEDRIVGLMFLLTLALRCLTLMEFQVRRQLQQQQTSMAGLYAGNPKRKTERPTAEQLLGAFRGITLYHHRDGTTEITPLNPIQQLILSLMRIPASIYSVPYPT